MRNDNSIHDSIQDSYCSLPVCFYPLFARRHPAAAHSARLSNCFLALRSWMGHHYCAFCRQAMA